MQKKMVLISNGGEGDAAVIESLRASGLSFETIKLTKGEPLPQFLENMSGLAILGGPITIFDQDTTPFLKVYFNA